MSRSVVQRAYWAGIVAIVACSRVFYIGTVGPTRYDASEFEVPGVSWWVVLGALLVVSSHSVGLPELPTSRLTALLRAGLALLISLAVVSFAQLILAQVLLPRSSTGLVVVLLPVWTLLMWNLSTDASDWANQRDDVLLVTAQPEEAAGLIGDLADQNLERPVTLLATMSVEESRVSPDGHEPLVDFAARRKPTLIVLDRMAQDEPSIVAQVADLHGSGTRVRTLALFYEEWLGKLPVSELAQVSLLFDIGELHRIRYVRLKRVFDLAFSLIGMVGLALLLPVVMIGNLVGNRGELFFRQERVGKNGEPFTLFKFRTMTAGDDSSWTTKHDARVTRFGQLLRRTHLDELPQVVNVLHGDLSIVGPRPEQVPYVEELRTKIPFYDARHLVRPGLTGWAQVRLGYAASESDALEKLQYDFYYLRRQGLGFDVRIVGRTLREVVGGLGR